MFRKLLAAVALFLVLLPSQSYAWGREGHRIVAEIAEQYLEPATARQIRELLRLDNATTLAEVSTWADDIRAQRRNTAPWHFVDIPVDAASYDRARDCKRGNCVVAAIERFERVLAERSARPRARLEALKFLVHFIGDLHQPLHAADNHDRGGNQVRVTFLGHRTNLHAIWDSGILAPAVVQGDERSYALRLARSISDRDLARWQRGSVIDWANEAHAVARRVVYGALVHAPGSLPASYERSALPVVNEQLKKAGVRLAGVLNRLLGS
jgi:nuclease S1